MCLSLHIMYMVILGSTTPTIKDCSAVVVGGWHLLHGPVCKRSLQQKLALRIQQLRVPCKVPSACPPEKVGVCAMAVVTAQLLAM